METNNQPPRVSPKAQSHLDRAFAHKLRRELSDARRECELGILAAPDWAEIRSLYGMVLLELQEPRKAVDAFRQARFLDRSSRKIQENLETAEAALAAVEAAQAAQRAALARPPATAPIAMEPASTSGRQAAEAVLAEKIRERQNAPMPPVSSELRPVRERLSPTAAVLAYHAAPTPKTNGAAACQVCGKQDHTLRAVMYPWIMSMLIVTQRRTFMGVWCRRHRWQRFLIAGLVSSTLGWLGIPFGFLFTPGRLLELGRGGELPASVNAQMLRQLATQKVRRGDEREAIRCYAESMRFEYDAAAAKQLQALHARQGPAQTAVSPALLALLLPLIAMGGAALIGLMAGLLDYGLALPLGLDSPDGISIYVMVLSWGLTLALLFFAGQVIAYVLGAALARSGTRQLALALVTGVASAGLGLYGFLSGEALARFGHLLLTDRVAELAGESFSTLGAVLTRGGLYMPQHWLAGGGLAAMLYMGITLVAAGYFLERAVVTARATVAWQERLAMVRAQGPGQLGAAQPALLSWLMLGVLALLMGGAALAFPQRETVDVLAAADHAGRGNLLYSQRDYVGAARELEFAVSLRPNSADLHEELGWAYLNSDQARQAIPEFQAALRLAPDVARSKRGLGYAYVANGQSAEALSALKSSLEREPANGQALDQLGLIYYRQHRTADAIDAFNKSLALSDKDGSAQMGLGLALIDADKYDDAEVHLQAARDLLPKQAVIHFGLGTIYLQRGNLDAAIAAYEQALQLDAQYSNARMFLGLAYAARRDFDKALAAYEAVAQAQPNWAMPHALMAEVYYLTDRADALARERERAQVLGVSDATAQYYLARMLVAPGQLSRAESAFQSVIALAPDSSRNHLALAYVFALEERFTEANAEIDGAARLNARPALIAFYRSYVAALRGQLDEALTIVQQGLSQSKDDPDLLERLAWLQFVRGNLPDALATAQSVIKNRPYGDAHTTLAFVYEAQHDVQSAMAEAKIAAKLEPKTDLAHYIFGLCYADLGDIQNASAEYRTFLSLYQDRVYVRDFKARAEAYLAQ